MIRRDGPIVQKSISFAVEVIKYCDFLSERKKFIISNQLMKCGTSIGANVFEAQYSESRLDFIHKMKIAQKEANETLYWLILCGKMKESLKDHGTTKHATVDRATTDHATADYATIKKLNEILATLSKIITPAKKI